MQDNQDQKFDDHIVDQAWENMRMLLDQELPVANATQRKPVAWWWISTLVISLLTGVLCTYYLIPKSVHISAFPIAVEDNSAIAHADTDTPKQTITTTLSPAKKISADKALRLNHQTTPASTTTVTRPESNIPLPATHNDSDNNLPTTVKPENLKSNSATNPANIIQKIAESLESKVFSMEQLPSKTVSPLVNKPSSIPEAVAIEPAKRKKSFKLSIEGSVHSIGFQNINGYGAAILAERHNQGNRLYLKAGLGYDIITPDIIASEKELVFDNTALNRVTENNNTIKTNTALTALQKSYISINLGYQLNDKLAVEVGVQPSYIHSSTMQETWSHSDGTSNSSTPFVSRITDDDTSVQRRHLVLNTCLQYQLNPSIGLRLNYNHGLTDVFASSYNEAHLSGLKVAFAYYIR